MEMKDFSLEGKVALVTGASYGIGALCRNTETLYKMCIRDSPGTTGTPGRTCTTAPVCWRGSESIRPCSTEMCIRDRYIGGIAGFLNGNNSISQCYSTAAITGNYDGEYYTEQEGEMCIRDRGRDQSCRAGKKI